MESVIYQASDLASNKRVDFLNEARSGRARLRDKDGTSLVMLPEHDLVVLEGFARWSRLLRHLELMLERNQDVTVTDLGELAWLRVFDRDDLMSFAEELHGLLIGALADNNFELVNEAVREWRVTARQLSDPLRRAVLLSERSEADYESAEAPADS